MNEISLASLLNNLEKTRRGSRKTKRKENTHEESN